MSEGEKWAAEYAASIYLRELPDELLQRRYKDLGANLWSTGPQGEVTPPRSEEHRRQLLRLIVHVVCEQVRRKGDEVATFDEGAVRRAASAGYRPPKLRPPFSGSLACYAKFGEREHIRRSIEKGVLKVSPASSFDDSSLNDAQRDNELQHWTSTPNEQLMMELYGRNGEGEEAEIPVHKQEVHRGMSVPDFYVWCCALGYDARLFTEFKADAVLIIRDKSEFRSRFAKAMARELPASTLRCGALGYYDRYTTRPEQLVPIFTKSFEYLHQNEYRFAWPAASNTALKPIFPEIGPLTDIAEYHELEPDICDRPNS